MEFINELNMIHTGTGTGMEVRKEGSGQRTGKRPGMPPRRRRVVEDDSGEEPRPPTKRKRGRVKQGPQPPPSRVRSDGSVVKFRAKATPQILTRIDRALAVGAGEGLMFSIRQSMIIFMSHHISSRHANSQTSPLNAGAAHRLFLIESESLTPVGSPGGGKHKFTVMVRKMIVRVS